MPRAPTRQTVAQELQFWNAIALVIFILLAALALWLVARFGPDEISLALFDFIVLALASFRLAHLFTNDKIFDFVRALEFLMENGLVPRIESRNAFLACAHDHDAAAMVAFLICERCGSVGEIPATPVAQGLNAVARGTGFAPRLSVVEITGTCAHCLKSL